MAIQDQRTLRRPVYLSPDEDEALRELADEAGVSDSAFLRMLLREAVTR